MSEYKVILVKANWCIHCQDFFPIFKQANKLNNNKDIKYFTFDTVTKEYIQHDKSDDDENEDESKNEYKNKTKKEFSDEYQKLEKSIQGFPSVFVVIKDKDGNELDNLIEHVVIDDKEGKTLNERYKIAAESLNTNILNAIKTLNTDGKKLYIEAEAESSDISNKNK